MELVESTNLNAPFLIKEIGIMKNQYVGDIGDYGKYSLLRAFAQKGIKIGFNWYLTKNDDSNDGKFTDYLSKTSMSRYCPEVFDALKSIVKTNGNDKTIYDVQAKELIPGAIYYPDLMNFIGSPKERADQRELWFEKSLRYFEGCDLIFLDPDNGLLEKGDASKRGAEKYVLHDEVERYFNAGYNVVYYCHKGRRTQSQWGEYKSIMIKNLSDASSIVLTFHKGSQRSYIFIIHEDDYEIFKSIIDDFMKNWNDVFSEEEIESTEQQDFDSCKERWEYYKEQFPLFNIDTSKVEYDKNQRGKWRYTRKGESVEIAGDCFFNFNETKVKLYKKLKPLSQSTIIKLEDCAKKHHSNENCVLMPVTGGMNNVKGKIYYREKDENFAIHGVGRAGILLDRPDTFIYFMSEFFKARKRNYDLMSAGEFLSNSIFREALNTLNFQAIYSFMNSFQSIEEYCGLFYGIDKAFTQRMIRNGKKPIKNEKDLIRYIELAEDFWSIQRGKF